MELNKDKLFTENDMEECWDAAHQAGRFEGKGIAKENWQTFEAYMEDLKQPTEIDVVIDMSNIYAVPEPKIDSEGCLILKRL
jgi:hypothetical protein